MMPAVGDPVRYRVVIRVPVCIIPVGPAVVSAMVIVAPLGAIRPLVTPAICVPVSASPRIGEGHERNARHQGERKHNEN